jgi:hypothetical protein
MTNLLLALLTFVGVMLVLALAAQSIQEILKTMFVIKGATQMRAMQGLVREAVRYQGQFSIDAESILSEVTRRLAALGQKAWRKNKVRLDELSADNLRDLIESVPIGSVPGLPVAEADAKAALKAIAAQAAKWYPLAVCPVDARYRRRMRVLALVASALVVVPLNAGADRIFNLARTDPSFRARVDSIVAHLRTLPESEKDSARDSVAADSVMADTATADTAMADTAASGTAGRNPRAEAALKLALTSPDSLSLFATPGTKDLGSPIWWVGIVLSVLLVSLGAPFWHDLLESLFGLKNRIRAEAQQAREGQTREGQTRSEGRTG